MALSVIPVNPVTLIFLGGANAHEREFVHSINSRHKTSKHKQKQMQGFISPVKGSLLHYIANCVRLACFVLLCTSLPCAGLAKTIYVRFFGREITKYTVIYSVHIRFWPALTMCVWNKSVSEGVL